MRRPTSVVLSGLVVLALVLPASAAQASQTSQATESAAPGTAASSGAAADPDTDSVPEQAQEALAEVEEVFAEDGVPAAKTPELSLAPGSRDEVADEASESTEATLALRDLAVLRTSLSGADRAAAAAYLARPTDDSGAPYGATYRVPEAKPRCDDDVCVHRVTSTSDQASSEYASEVLRVVGDLHDRYTGAGYREPKADGQRGGNAKTDIYLADVGGAGVYGYCTSDQAVRPKQHDVWAYCVLDNDYDPEQFPAQTPAENLRVTAAHEYFHAVQFGYDITEDVWFLEGTATWVEDEVFDSIDDNVQYLKYGPMGRPATSMDLNDGGFGVYGSWSFFRFLTERFDETSGGLPRLVRSMWRSADARGDAPDRYSLDAIAAALRARSTTLRSQFAAYAAANRNPARAYEEGRVNRYPTARLAGSATLGGAKRRYRATRRVDHLASRTFRLAPRYNVGSRGRVRISLDLPPSRRGSEARVSLERTNGTVKQTRIRLNRQGNRTLRRPFAAGVVAAVEVTLVNASTRMRYCESRTEYSCGGLPRDDNRPMSIDARLLGG